MDTIKNLEPKEVWKYFYDFTQIPRPSGKEEKILKYIIDFAKTHNFEYKQDRAGNVVIRKQATKGRENSPSVTFQGHVDMVCEKNSDTIFDFDNDPIQSYIDNEWVKAKGTTLGADCGIGCAIILAILASNDISHPRIEALFTIEEETGLKGAFEIENDMITSKYLVNLDSEDEGEIFVGCAGGKDTVATFNYTPQSIKENTTCVQITIKGLSGGHSGDDINKNLGNANIILARFLINHTEYIQIVNIDGGNLRNAIPREAKALLAIDNSKLDYITASVSEYEKDIKKELFVSEPNVSISIQKQNACFCQRAMDATTAKNLLSSIITCPNGVIAMSQDMENFVETSTNLASIKQKNNAIVISTSQRSSLESKKNYLSQVVKASFERYNAVVEQSNGYPGWTPILSSHLLDVFKQEYKNTSGKIAKVKAIHAGLECGLFLDKFPDLEMVSVGPTLRGVHSPDEKLEISAVEQSYLWIRAVLENI